MPGFALIYHVRLLVAERDDLAGLVMGDALDDLRVAAGDQAFGASRGLERVIQDTSRQARSCGAALQYGHASAWRMARPSASRSVPDSATLFL